MAIDKTFVGPGEMDGGDGGSSQGLLSPDALLELLSFLPHPEAQRTLQAPLSKVYLSSFTLEENIWKARCVEQWKVPPNTTCHAWRTLHIDLVHCLSLVDGTAEETCGGGDYGNVVAIVQVLDAYRTLAEMTRACFDRLGHLLNSEEAREAVKCVDWRIMDHALWALKTYPDDVDLLLKILRFLVLAGRPAGRMEGAVMSRPPASDGPLRAFGPSGNGVEAVLACMERHRSNAAVQAVACWSLVNLALIPGQKRSLCRQGGVLAIVRAMARHPQDSEVHFRAMFALINLVTPDVTSEKIIQPDTMKAVVAIVVSAIQAFSNMVTIVNRACLVLHNIALDPGHLGALVAIGAPEELLHAIGKHPTDALLIQCATGTLRRLGR
ncbi:unnamed protein product [Ectocarpus sp. CCAP 1310/34]|nr:unnamed protein product [Ectocarpus sp. CCAP 1310/34]